MLAQPLAITLQVIDAFEIAGIPYMIGGSLASALHGVARSTLDTDLVADLQPEHIPPLVERLKDAFYVDESMILDAVIHQTSFNLIHLETMFRVDVFVLKPYPFDQNQIRRRTPYIVSTDPERSVYVTTPEDIILAKLSWYRQGGEGSQRQWQDVLGVIKVQAGNLDLDYLRQWAVLLGVRDLLDLAIPLEPPT